MLHLAERCDPTLHLFSYKIVGLVGIKLLVELKMMQMYRWWM